MVAYRTSTVGFEADTGCPATELEIYLQRHVRLHQRNFLGEDARSRDRRQHCTEWPRDAGKGKLPPPLCPLLTYNRFQAVGVIETTQKWSAKVVYGDTDSLFVYLPGKTKDQAFRIGYDIAETITVMNPSPIKLKFEKVGPIYTSSRWPRGPTDNRSTSRVFSWLKSVMWGSNTKPQTKLSRYSTPKALRPSGEMACLPKGR